MKLIEALQNYKAYFVDANGKLIKAGEWHEGYVKKVAGLYHDKDIWKFIDKLLLKGWIKIRTTHMEVNFEYVVGEPNSKTWKIALEESLGLNRLKAITFAGFKKGEAGEDWDIIEEKHFESIEDFLNSKLAKRYMR